MKTYKVCASHRIAGKPGTITRVITEEELENLKKSTTFTIESCEEVKM